ncbi:acetoacetate decarboxylase family protein [Steroidobacter flavus]|uniref:Acetoacetate decarboxylase family protein n=1 Tax=Steroidobacter flavus TaxID=1842136 RepID=A0ABV8SS97_9GAMM
MALDDPRFQSAPWTLRGEAIVGLKLVRSDVARQFVPADAKVVCVWPGRTLAILYLCKYWESPVGSYHEVIVAPALVWRKGRLGFWISHIGVDHATSIAAGRAIWALPKEPVSMEWIAGRARASGSGLNAQALFEPPRRSIRLPFAGVAMSKYRKDESWFAARGSARVAFARASVELGGDPGLGQLGFVGTMSVVVCEQMKIKIGRPHR